VSRLVSGHQLLSDETSLSADPTLLEVVPWPYGFGHSWAVRWLLSQPELAPLVLGAVPGWELGPKPRVVDVPRTEARFKGVRADLAFSVATEGQVPEDVALETKVEDTFRARQVAAYRDAGHTPLMYLPGLTGFLIGGNTRESDELYLTGENLAAALSDALDGKVLPRMIDSYLRVVGHEAIRFNEALISVRNRGSAPESQGETPWPSLLDVAWLVEVHRGIKEHAPAYDIATDCSLRAEANDRGVFWHGCRKTFPSLSHDDQVGLYIDVIASVHRQRWSIAIKAGWGNGKLAPVVDYARNARTVLPPGGQGEWRVGNRNLRGASKTVWSTIVTGMKPTEAAEIAVQAAVWIRDVAAAAESESTNAMRTTA